MTIANNDATSEGCTTLQTAYLGVVACGDSLDRLVLGMIVERGSGLKVILLN